MFLGCEAKWVGFKFCNNRLVLVFKIKVFIAEGVVDFGMLMGMRILV